MKFISLMALPFVIGIIFLSGCIGQPAGTNNNNQTQNNTNPEPTITIYCTQNNCSPQSISLGAGTLAQGCYRNLNDCTSAQTTNTTPPSTPQTYSVNLQSFSFTPASLTIKVGDSVTWTNMDSTQHTVTSDSGSELSSQFLSQGGTYQHTFNQAGTFAYHCSIHPSMHGTVIVQ